MVARFILQPGRIILSQPGYAATFGMPDSQKIFDSNWNYSGVVLETGQAGGYGGQVVDTGSTTRINWRRDYGYIPAGFITQLGDDGSWGPGWDFYYEKSVCDVNLGDSTYFPVFMTSSYCDLARHLSFGGGPLRWMLFGVV